MNGVREEQTTKAARIVGEDCPSRKVGIKTCCEEDVVQYQAEVKRDNWFWVKICREL